MGSRVVSYKEEVFQGFMEALGYVDALNRAIDELNALNDRHDEAKSEEEREAIREQIWPVVEKAASLKRKLDEKADAMKSLSN